MTPKTRIFLAHASEDKDRVRDLYSKLVDHGFAPWLDEMQLLPGQNWQIEIAKAIRESDIFVACLSRISVRKRGYVQRELRTVKWSPDLRQPLKIERQPEKGRQAPTKRRSKVLPHRFPS